ncbi:hypothetical protein [Alteribacillus sp. YIM 98480]|uniref:hypothetical protein n=1 Tax=Alteribacillus sp. YIM 98480 TaxID=2606599 RepID=UPI001E43FDE2|nr:hypothetical protein [Alteribacillus sp. YIM 98480]
MSQDVTLVAELPSFKALALFLYCIFFFLSDMIGRPLPSQKTARYDNMKGSETMQLIIGGILQ